MHKMVEKPNLIADDALNEKIERMFNNTLFQRMVERADTIQDKEEEMKDTELPLTSIKVQEQFIKKVAQEAKKEEVPHFGGRNEPEMELEHVETPVKEKKQEVVPLESANESFGVNEKACKTPITEPQKESEIKKKEKPQKQEEIKKTEIKKEEVKKEIVENQKEDIDEYIDDEDMGYVIKEVDEDDFERTCKRLAAKYGYPARSIKQDPTMRFKKKDDDESDEESSESRNDSAVFDPTLAKSKREKFKEEKKNPTKKGAKENIDGGIEKLESLVKKVDET